MRKHAYLIIAHNEFAVLQRLIDALDDGRNDIYIHIDKKVKKLPHLTAVHSHLVILEKRICVYWGHTTQLEAEYALLESAWGKENYSYYHMISGVHLPLRSQDDIHRFFNDVEHSCLMRQEASLSEVNLKMKRYNFFVKHKYKRIARIEVFLWHLLIVLQRILKIFRNRNKVYQKSSQWLSLNSDAVNFLMREKKMILKSYKYTYCADEFFIASELSRSGAKIKNCPDLLKCDFEGVSPKIYKMTDYDELISSGCLFARKFSEQNMDVVNKIMQHIKLTQ